MKALNTQTLCALLAAMLIAYGIKNWYRDAPIEQLQWLMQPLAVVLGMLLPGDFDQNYRGEWFNPQWQIVLVKSCSGIHFFILSFIVYVLLLQVKLATRTQRSSIALVAQAVLLALPSAWLTTVVVNAGRIVLAITLVHYPQVISWTGLSEEAAHRMAGLLVYYPALYLQTCLARVFSLRAGYYLSVALFVALLVLVPILTGTAFLRPTLFLQHALSLLVFCLLFGVGLLTLGKFRRSGPARVTLHT